MGYVVALSATEKLGCFVFDIYCPTARVTSLKLTRLVHPISSRKQSPVLMAINIDLEYTTRHSLVHYVKKSLVCRSQKFACLPHNFELGRQAASSTESELTRSKIRRSSLLSARLQRGPGSRRRFITAFHLHCVILMYLK